MKLFMLLILISGALFARSVVPPRIVYPNLNIFEKAQMNDDGTVSVKATSYDEVGRFKRNGTRITLPLEQYEEFKRLSMPVFQMIPESEHPANDGRRGTAFSIGESLVLTNAHVLNMEFKNTTECADFQIKNNEGHTFDCKKVHYCSAFQDVCLIEIKPLTISKKACLFCASEKIQISLADGPALKLKASYFPTNNDHEVMTAIGNSGGWGIHISQGRGIEREINRFKFWAPIRSGNSGGALINEEGLVIGVVKQETNFKISQFTNYVYNIATPTDIVISLIRRALQDDPETLEKFNRSVVE
ncbi:S1 family peptidase [Peredibacter starrii]|uniref:Serine protease n=1 Tax=Peredibacter starrii TaxID=28202 RepID=A0AAX4HVS1_9BACT|nr:serine protease [Peredibacter starrii]WPU67089.1 serine protease [Peredibacter starrii]